MLALVACVHAGIWALLQRKETAPSFTGQLASVSYSPTAHSDHPESDPRPTPEKIRADLKALAPYTRAIRTYSSTDGSELVPPIAAEFGLKVTVGAVPLLWHEVQVDPVLPEKPAMPLLVALAGVVK